MFLFFFILLTFFFFFCRRKRRSLRRLPPANVRYEFAVNSCVCGLKLVACLNINTHTHTHIHTHTHTHTHTNAGFSFPAMEDEILAYWKSIDAFQNSLKFSEGRPE